MKTFEAKFTSKIEKFVGVDFHQTGNGYILLQTNMIEKLLKKYEINDSLLPITPMIEALKWDSKSVALTDIRVQQVLLGELSYINLCTRPDVSFSINKIARVTTKATKQSYRALKRVLKYLGRTKEKGLVFNHVKTDKHVLSIYSDASFADIVEDDMKSTSGYITYLNGAVVDWKTSKIKWVCTSTCSAEFLGLYKAIMSTLHLAYLLEEVFQINVFPVKFFCDNKSAITIASSEGSNHTTRYLGTKYYAVNQLVSEGKIEIHYVNTTENRSDGFTKSLGPTLFKRFVDFCFNWFSEFLNQGQESQKTGNALNMPDPAEACVTDSVTVSNQGESETDAQNVKHCLDKPCEENDWQRTCSDD